MKLVVDSPEPLGVIPPALVAGRHVRAIKLFHWEIRTGHKTMPHVTSYEKKTGKLVRISGTENVLHYVLAMAVCPKRFEKKGYDT
jgi:hypothetical protein